MRLTFILTALALIALPAKAETSAMRYTRINQKPAESTTMKLKTIKHDDEAAKQEPEEDEQVRIWNKYKALAAGKTEEEKADEAEVAKKQEAEKEETEKAEKETEEEESKTVEAVDKEKIAEPERPTGIAAIIDEYKKNKAQRSQMRSITVTKPSDVQPAAGEPKAKPET